MPENEYCFKKRFEKQRNVVAKNCLYVRDIAILLITLRRHSFSAAVKTKVSRKLLERT